MNKHNADEQVIVDVIVVGGGPAGLFAATDLAHSGLSVILLDHPRLSPRQPARTWLSPLAMELFQEAHLPLEGTILQPVQDCYFFSHDLARMIKPQLPAARPSLIDSAGQKKKMVAALLATRVGQYDAEYDVQRITLGEEQVTLLDKSRRQYRGRLLLLATSFGHPLVQSVGLAASQSNQHGLQSAQLEFEAPVFAESGRMDYFLGLGNAAGFGYRLARDGGITLGVCVAAPPVKIQELLQQLADRLVQKQLLPANWRNHLPDAKMHWSPAGLCLEMESHIAKRTMLIGEAGGFVAAYTNESFFPGIWSAKIAGQVIREALGSTHPQDKLRYYEQLWRTQMADYLRPPHSDAQSLLPLVFGNQQIADKLFLAMHSGINF
ncbi:MAG: hypothetical protein HJJLKODD_02825 [Phycisphaerae bacterium]|nr:hypothetical protein [Phycisphaerae bacterium]